LDWIEYTVLRPRQRSIGYMGDGFYGSKDPTNCIKVLKEKLQRKTQKNQTSKYTHKYEIVHAIRIQVYNKYHSLQ